MRLNSIRIRLTLWYALILLLMLVVLGTVVYVSVKRSQERALDDSINARAEILYSLTKFDTAGRPFVDDVEGDARLRDTFGRLFEVDGTVVIGTAPQYGEVPVNQTALELARQRKISRQTLEVPGLNGDLRVLTVPVLRNNGEIGALAQVGDTTEHIDDTLGALLAIFGILAPVGLGVALVGGWWLSSRALAPIDEITQTARIISEGDLSRRIDTTAMADDEVGRLAHTFDEMLARLETSVRRQREFTANASHELRTPIAAIKGQVDVALQQERSPEEYREVLRRTNDQLARMTRLVEGILMLARFDAQTMPLEMEDLAAGDIVESVAELVTPIAQEKGLALRTIAGEPARVRGDETLLLQLMLNLADNAIKYTNQGEVRIGWRRTDGRVELFVEDTGPGVAPEHQQAIFEPFYRAPEARSSSGSGLGLSISRWICTVHEGRIGVSSVPGRTRFTASLPEAPRELAAGPV